MSKKEVFRLPDPFAVVTVDGEQTKTTSVIKKTLNPYWNESFLLSVSSDSVFTIQIFDQRKWKKEENQGFLGLVNILMSNVFDIDNEDGDELLTLELKKGNNNGYVSGKIVVNITTLGVENDGSDVRVSIPPAEFLSTLERPSSRQSRERLNSENSSNIRKPSPSRLAVEGSSSGTGNRNRQGSSRATSPTAEEDPLPTGYK